MNGGQWAGGGWGHRGKGVGIKHKLVENRQGDVKNRIGKGKAKNLYVHGHEQRRGYHWREWGVLGGGEEREKNWDNCNSIIN